MNAELSARRTAAAALLADYRTALATAPISQPPGREWMLRLADVLGALLRELGHEPAVTLGQHQAATVLAAVADAAEGIRDRAAHCRDCQASPCELCDGCAARLDRASAYEALAKLLRAEVAR